MYILSEKQIFAWNDLTLILDLQTSFNVTTHLLTIDTLRVKYDLIRLRGEKKCSRQGHFFEFCCDPLPTGTLGVNYEPDLANGRDDILRK